MPRKAPGFLPEGYKTSTRTTVEGIATTGQVAKRGTVAQTEHWSGRLDATVRPRAIGLKLQPVDGAPLNPAHVEAVAEYQAAVDELRLARASGEELWIAAAERRANRWRARILETQ